MPLPVPEPSPARQSQMPKGSLPTPPRTSTRPPSSENDPLSSPSRIPSPARSTRAPTTRRSFELGAPLEANLDNSKMPPPPPPAPAPSRTRSMRAPSTNKDSGTDIGRSGLGRSGLGRPGGSIRRAAGTRDLKSKEEKKPAATDKTARLRNTTTVRTAGREKDDKERGATLGRTMSLRTPRTSSAAPGVSTSAAPTAATKTVAGSAKTATVARFTTSTTRERAVSTSKRPTSLEVPSTSANATKATAAPPGTGTVRGHRRNISTPSKIQQRPGTAASNLSTMSKSQRPPFSTLTQDFDGPRKPAPTQSRRAMPPPPLDPATVHQQTELLQYTCLYSNSHAAYAQMTASATAKLKRRFDVLAKEHSRSREQLARRQRTHDLTGLAAVIETPSAGIATGKRRETIRSPEEKIQAFSEAIKKLEALQQNEHRVLAAEFGEWIAGYSPPSPGGGMDKKGWVSRRGRWIDGLGEDWRRQVLFISRRIEGCVQAIESIVAAVVVAEEAGVIAVVSERWMEVARGLLDECQGMLQVEQNVVSRERSTLEDVVAGVVGKVGLEVLDEGGVWTRS